MRTSLKVAVVSTAVMSMGLAACGSDKSDDAGSSSSTTKAAAVSGKVGVILPDSKSSIRWETSDRKYLEEAFKAAGIEYDIQNAEGSATTMQTIADQMITSGVDVLMIVNLDSGSGATIEKKAQDAGIKTIDYDRLTLGGNADVYVSFDNVKVGELQGKGLEKCLTDKNVTKPSIIQIHGSPTDNNATLFKQGYQSVLDPLFTAGTYVKGGDQAVPDWDPVQGQAIFEQLLTANGGKVDGVLSANDGLAGAIITVLKKNNLQVPVTGQDASVAGLQAILDGDQCMTVYKAVKTEADAASAAAISLVKGETPETNGTVTDTQTKKEVPSVLATPVAIYKDNVKDVISDGFQTKADVCTAAYATKCADAGIE